MCNSGIQIIFVQFLVFVKIVPPVHVIPFELLKHLPRFPTATNKFNSLDQHTSFKFWLPVEIGADQFIPPSVLYTIWLLLTAVDTATNTSNSGLYASAFIKLLVGWFAIAVQVPVMIVDVYILFVDELFANTYLVYFGIYTISVQFADIGKVAAANVTPEFETIVEYISSVELATHATNILFIQVNLLNVLTLTKLLKVKSIPPFPDIKNWFVLLPKTTKRSFSSE